MSERTPSLHPRTVSRAGGGWSGRISGFRCTVRTLHPGTDHGMARRLARWRPVLSTIGAFALRPAATAFVFRHSGEPHRATEGARILVRNGRRSTVLIRQSMPTVLVRPPGSALGDDPRQPGQVIRPAPPPPAPRRGQLPTAPHPSSALRTPLAVRHLRSYVRERIHQPHLVREPRPSPEGTPDRPDSPVPEAIAHPHRTRRPPLIVRTATHPVDPPTPHPASVQHPGLPTPPPPPPRTAEPPAPPPTPDLDRLTDLVLSRIERRAVAQRERFGRS